MDISKIKVGNTTYDVKDTTARDNSLHYVTSVSGTAGKKSVNRSIWTGTVSGITSLYTGLTVQIKVPVAGVSAGVVLNINDLGEHPVVHNVSTLVTTHYAVGTILTLVYDADQTASVTVSGTATSITGCWKLSLYDSNNDVQMRLYKQITDNATWNLDYPLIASRTLSSGIAETDSKYVSIYGLIGSSSVNPTVNPITGDVKVKSLTLDGTTLESKTASASGTDLSLVTTGEKAIWDAKLSASSTLDATNLSGTIPAGCYTNTWIAASTSTDGYVPAATAGKYLHSNASTGALEWVDDNDTWRPLGTGSTDACAGNDPRLSDSRPASDVYSWAKASTKPDYAYSEIGYTVNTTTSAGGTLSLAGTTPLHVVTLTGNVSALTLSSNPADGHSCHVILTSTAAQTVAIAHDATNRICPGAADISLDVPAGGYVEIDFLSANNKVFVRGV